MDLWYPNIVYDLGWGAVSDLSLISDLSQKFKHDLWRVKSELKLSQKQHLTPDLHSHVRIHLYCIPIHEVREFPLKATEHTSNQHPIFTCRSKDSVMYKLCRLGGSPSWNGGTYLWALISITNQLLSNSVQRTKVTIHVLETKLFEVMQGETFCLPCI